VARKLKHALRLKQLLTEAELDYVVEAEEYSAGAIFPRMRVGAFFYVSPASDSVARCATSRWLQGWVVKAAAGGSVTRILRSPRLATL
jgi:hypothetical protein